jgi:hypothetical protein
MDTITNADLQDLLVAHKAPCVSIYLPTHPTGREGESDALRLTQLVDQAQERIAEMGGRAVEVRDFVAPLRGLENDTTFWQHRNQGLAIFFSSDTYQRFRLPIRIEPQFAVGSRFLTRPLLPLISNEDRFLLLTLSQNQVRLYEGDRQRLARREVPNLPINLKSELNLVSADQGRKQMHAVGPDPKHHHATIYHGHGGKPDAHKVELRSFFKAVDEALHPALRSLTLPLMIAGVGYELAIFREVNTYPNLAAEQLDANCDYLSDYELHRQVWPVVQKSIAGERERYIHCVYDAADKARRQTDIRDILRASHDGRVDVLWIDDRAFFYGGFDPAH